MSPPHVQGRSRERRHICQSFQCWEPGQPGLSQGSTVVVHFLEFSDGPQRPVQDISNSTCLDFLKITSRITTAPDLLWHSTRLGTAPARTLHPAHHVIAVLNGLQSPLGGGCHCTRPGDTSSAKTPPFFPQLTGRAMLRAYLMECCAEFSFGALHPGGCFYMLLVG